MKLTARQEALLREATHYEISDAVGDYYRLGGRGVAPIRFNRSTLPKLERMGLVTRKAGYWKATEAGMAAVGLGFASGIEAAEPARPEGA